MAEERPSKVSASWASNGWGSTSRALTPAEARARARVVPAMPAPAMMTSASWSRMGGYGAWGAVVSRGSGRAADGLAARDLAHGDRDTLPLPLRLSGLP